MIAPRIHLNGTSREALLRQQVHARNYLRLAIRQLQAAAPNGRDYYPIGPNALGIAQAEHQARLKKLDEVQNELETLARMIQEAP